MQTERIWRQSTPQGTFAVVYIEAHDPGQTFAGAASSTDPFDVWWRERRQWTVVGGQWSVAGSQ